MSPKKKAIRVVNFPIVVELLRNGTKLRENWITWGVPVAGKLGKGEIAAQRKFIEQFLPPQTLANSKGEQVRCVIGDPHTEFLDPDGFN